MRSAVKRSAVVVIGYGRLADTISRKLSINYHVLRQTFIEESIPEETELVLVLHDAWFPAIHQAIEERLRSTDIPWLRGFVAFGEGVIGPLVRPGRPGCSQCADWRRLMSGRDRREMFKLQQKQADQRGKTNQRIENWDRSDPWASCSGIRHMTNLIDDEVHRILHGQQPHLAEHLFFINLKTLNSSLHFFLPDPICSVCSQLPDDSPDEAHISLKPSLKVHPDTYRCRSLEEFRNDLIHDYLDDKIGFLQGKMYNIVSPFADTSVNLPLLTDDEGVAGRTHSFAHSELAAILEGLERYCGLTPRSKRPVVHGTYRQLADRALYPLKVGVHAHEQYARPDFPFQAFDPDRPMDWVWGYSFSQERPILVPQVLAYYSVGCGNGFVYETSNGCALGGSLEEAIFYGILEVVERDSFLLTWYAQLPLPRIDPYSVPDQELQLMIERVRTVGAYDIFLFNSTMENGIPSVWALAKNRKDRGLNLICAAGAHPDPIRAMKGAIHELAGMMHTLDEKFEKNREKYVQMFHDSSLVQQMEDHGMLYGLPQAEERLQFLLDEKRPLRTYDEEYRNSEWLLQERPLDLTEDLKKMLQIFHELDLDVIVVDQTVPEIKRNGLHCVKVLIPGMMPMTFGHHLTRLTGLDRVLRIPAELGYSKQSLTPEQLNPYPHPFP